MGGAFSNLETVFCALFGPNSTLIALIAAAAVLVFFVILALNEGNSMMTWAIKILIGVAGLVSAMGMLKSLFGTKSMCTGAGSLFGEATPVAPDMLVAANEAAMTVARLLV